MALGASVKGITIEFEANTTKLGAALKDVDAKTRSLDKNIRAVDKALKFNPGNTELVAQKQKYLGDKIGETKTRLEALKSAQAKLDDDPAVDKTSQDYMELQREIITTESKLNHFQGEMQKLNNLKFEQAGKAIQNVGSKMQAVGEGMTKYVTAPIIGVGAASLKAFNDVDAGLDIVSQKTGATGKDLEGMQKSVKNLATQIPTDFETAGAAVGEVNTRFGLTGKELEQLSGKFVKFADLNNTDVSSSIDSVQKAMEAFGIPAQKAGPMLDTLNRVGQNTGISMDELTQSLVKNAPALQAMGLDANQSATFLGQLEKSGVDSSKVMTGLQKALVNGAKAGKDMPTVMKEVQESIVGAKDDTEAMNKASELFGAKAGPAIATAARSGALDFQTLGKEATNAAGSVDKTFNDTLDPIDKFKTTMNSAKVAGAEIGNSLMTILAPALDKLASVLQKAAAWWEGLSPGMQNFIVKAALVAAAIGPALTIFGKFTTGIGSLISIIPKIARAFQLVGVAFKAVGAIFAANPILIAVAAAVAAGILLYKNWDKVKKFLSKTWNTITKTASKLFEGMKKNLGKIWDGIKSAAQKVWDTYKTIITTPIRLAVAAVKRIVDGLKSALSAAWNTIKTAATKAWNGIKDAISKPINAAKDAVKNAYDAMKKKVAEKVSAAASWLSDVRDKISNATKTAKSNVASNYDAMKKKVAEKVSAAGSWNTEVKNKISNAISAAATSVKDNYNSMKAKVGEKVSATDTWNGSVKDKIKNAINTAKDVVSSGIEKIKGYLGQKVSLSSSLSGFGSAIADKASTAWNAVRDAFNNIKNKIGSIHIKFPSIKLPHFKITSKGKFPWGVGGKGSLPSWDVSWYARGGIFTKPTLLNGGTVGVGEAGAEAVLPLERLFSEMNGMFNSMADNIVNGLITAQRLQAAGQMAGDIHLDVYLFPSGPKMREEIVHAYDEGKKILG